MKILDGHKISISVIMKTDPVILLTQDSQYEGIESRLTIKEARKLRAQLSRAIHAAEDRVTSEILAIRATEQILDTGKLDLEKL